MPYRDASVLVEQARRELTAQTAGAGRGRGAHAGGRRRAGAGRRRARGRRARRRCWPRSAPCPPTTCRPCWCRTTRPRRPRTRLAKDLTTEGRKALARLEWGRAGRYAAALLLLDPSSVAADEITAKAEAGQRLSAKLAEARQAARDGEWRKALRLALAVQAARKDFPGAASLVADARKALKPKPQPTAPLRSPRRHDHHHVRRHDHRGRRLLRRLVPAAAAMMRRPPPARAPRGAHAAPGAGLAALVPLACVTAPSASAARAAAERRGRRSPTPAGASWAVHDVTCVGSLSLALAGDGHVAVSRDAGQTWKTTVPSGHAGTAFTAVAFATGGRGVLASGGLLLVTTDWGATWAPPAYVGPRTHQGRHRRRHARRARRRRRRRTA